MYNNINLRSTHSFQIHAHNTHTLLMKVGMESQQFMRGTAVCM